MFKNLGYSARKWVFCVYLLILRRAVLRMVIGKWLMVTGYW